MSDPLANLPHGPEFRFLDGLDELDPGKSGKGHYQVPSPDELPLLRGHFPGLPILPGVLHLEALAQLAGVVAQCDPEHPPLANLRLTAFRAAKIFGAAEPGQRLVLEARVEGRMGGLIQAAGTCRVGDKILVQAQLTLSGDPPHPHV
jgi:3-hydroxyacyl-[acyl-carrier-protein] dehydratase